MSPPVKISITQPGPVPGSTTYRVIVTLTNVGQDDVSDVEVKATALPGRLIASSVEVTETNESELESRRRALIEEMEVQVAAAYEGQAMRSRPFSQQLAAALIHIMDGYAGLFMGRRTSTLAPTWAREAFRIYDWQDVEMLENEIISKEKPDSSLRIAFLLDKEKLKRCIATLSQGNPAPLDVRATLVPGATIAFPFTARAPHLFRRLDIDCQFHVTYRQEATGKSTSESVQARLNVLPSAFAVPTGGLLGAACGYAIKLAFSTAPDTTPAIQWVALGGSLLLGLVFALLVARKPDAHKAITVDDFLGGFIIGVLTGMFSDGVIDRLRVLFAGST